MTDLRDIENADPPVIMRSILQRIATGPELSKDIALEEARAGMRAILKGQVNPVQAGLEALDGKPGPTREALVYSAALCLWHLGRYNTLRTAADAVRAMLDSGAVLVRLQQTNQPASDYR